MHMSGGPWTGRRTLLREIYKLLSLLLVSCMISVIVVTVLLNEENSSAPERAIASFVA